MQVSRKIPKLILFIFSVIVIAISSFFVIIEVINIMSKNYEVFLHPFNGLQRYISRSFTFLFLILTAVLSIVNIFKSSPVKTRILSVALVANFLVSFTFLVYLDLFVFLIFNIVIILCMFLHYYIYWYIPNKKVIKQILTKNNNQ